MTEAERPSERVVARAADLADAMVDGVTESTWGTALNRLGQWADELDHVRSLPTAGPHGPAPIDDGPGPAASGWAVVKAAATMVTAPVALPMMAVGARMATAACRNRIADYPAHLRAVAEGRPPLLPARRNLRIPADRRYVITSDLHRCIPGKLDWPDRQQTKRLYASVLETYAADGWDLVENGDVEDFWMVGGSTWGAVYDAAGLAGTVAGPLGVSARRDVVREHLDRIVDNNAAVYGVLRDGFCADGRYHRTMGNHDDVYTDPALVEHLATHLPGTEMADMLLLTAPGCGDEHGIDGVAAAVAHGHLTDSWNGPGYARLGRAVTWLATGLDDLPGLPTVDGLPDEEIVEQLLRRGARNRLISVDRRFGGNRRGDSLDEQRLFRRLAEHRPEVQWPWLAFGHTHFPMLWPLDEHGERVRYANSGCGVLRGAFTALEWEPATEEFHLVVWVDERNGPRRVELVPDGPTLRPA
ncbi:MAG: hypothetical protein ACKO04_12540 [Actinomycetes bacterium]